MSLFIHMLTFDKTTQCDLSAPQPCSVSQVPCMVCHCAMFVLPEMLSRYSYVHRGQELSCGYCALETGQQRPYVWRMLADEMLCCILPRH